MKAISGPSPRIAQRIQNFFAKENVCGGQFDPYRPAAYLLNKHLEFRSEIDDSTVDKAASMFNRVNSLLSVNGSGNGPAPLHQRRQWREDSGRCGLFLRPFAGTFRINA